MQRPFAAPSRRLAALLVIVSLGIGAGAAKGATPPDRDAAAALGSRYAALADRLEHSAFQQRLLLESAETPHGLQGDIWAVVDYPLATITATVTSPAHWCEALILHLNVKYCRPVARGAGTALSMAIGRKYNQPLGDAFPVELACRIAAAGPDYVEVDLEADRGPFATTNYRMMLEAIPLEAGRAFVHLRYSYQYGIEARLAMDPRTRDFVRVNGRSYEREPLDAAWILERFPPERDAT